MDLVNTTLNTGKRQASNLAGMFIPLVVGTIVVSVVLSMMKK